MSPARQPNGSSQRRKIARQTPIDPTLQTERSAISPSVTAKKIGACQGQQQVLNLLLFTNLAAGGGNRRQIGN
jgi:hypothetical protein